MVDLPSQLPDELVAASAGRRMVLRAMHSVVHWLAFGVWEDGRLIRSLSLSPDGGIVENIGRPLPFEGPYWAGERRAEVIPWPDEDDEPYALPFHPLEMGEDALRALCGFIVDGRPDPAVKEAALRAAVAAMAPPRTYVLGPDGALIKRDALWPMAPP